MLINTRDFGEVNISENEIITFPEGIYAFEDDHRYVLLSPCGENKYPMWLQSVDNSNVCFIVFNPFEFDEGYAVTIDDETVKNIEINGGSVLDYLVIAVIPGEYVDSTVNMKSPIVVNSDNNKAAQIIAPENYPIKFPVFKKEEIK